MSKIRCTRNEMHEIMKQYVSDCYNGIHTWEEYRNLAFDIIPLDFSKYPQIKEETQKYINAVFDKEDTDRNGNYMLRGFIMDSYAKLIRDINRLGITYFDHWGYNDAEMLIYTFCEGDTTLTVFSDRETYIKEREATEKWYKENY